MKLVLVLTVVCLGSAWGHPGFFSLVSDTTSAVRQTAINTAKATTNVAVNTAKATTNAAVNTAKATTNAAVNTAKATTNMALNAAESAKNMTVGAAHAGFNLVKNISMSAINSGASFLIQEVKSIVRKSGKDSIKIPDINVKKFGVGFTATKGYFKDITTLVQSGKANVTTNSTSLKIALGLKLDTIDIGFGQVNITALGMTARAGIKVHIKNDTFVVHLRLTPGFTCALNVEKVVVAELSGIEIDFTDVGKKSEWVLEKASKLIVATIKGQIKSQVQKAIDTSLRTVLKEDSAICSKFMS